MICNSFVNFFHKKQQEMVKNAQKNTVFLGGSSLQDDLFF